MSRAGKCTAPVMVLNFNWKVGESPSNSFPYLMVIKGVVYDVVIVSRLYHGVSRASENTFARKS